MMYQHAKFGCKWSSVSEDYEWWTKRYSTYIFKDLNSVIRKQVSLHRDNKVVLYCNLVNIAALALYMLLSLSVTINIHKNIPLKNVYCNCLKDMHNNNNNKILGTWAVTFRSNHHHHHHHHHNSVHLECSLTFTWHSPCDDAQVSICLIVLHYSETQNTSSGQTFFETSNLVTLSLWQVIIFIMHQY